ncbi:tuftelin isoform X1 [Bufo gargarizans]|uniref:tuftelin isoform X1 n=1 Tax=Bufo gargarizans TaxID=30331 RepID=UPI001CF5AA8F|nr:tuftelin isoform X1 [Bufo gargarizans]
MSEQRATMNGLCTLQQLQPEPEPDNVRTVRMTLRDDQSPEGTDTIKVKPVGRAFALISSHPLRGSRPLNSELVKSKDGDEEIIKVYLKAKAESKKNHEWNVCQLRNEVRQIHEARTSLTLLRQDLDASKHEVHQSDEEDRVGRQNGDGTTNGLWSQTIAHEEEFPLDNGKNMRETAQKLYARLQESERRHQADRKMYEEKLSHWQQEAEQSKRVRVEAQEKATEHQKEVEELRRLMSNMEKEHQQLLKTMKDNETELEKRREQPDGPLQERCQELEKTVSTLKEKIHHLDDMLKSQQRKVRQMIEQLQNSRTAMQEKDSVIQELREKVTWLQAENLELQDKLEHFLSSQPGHASYLPRSYSKPNLQNIKRVYLPAGSGRPLPLIKLVET